MDVFTSGESGTVESHEIGERVFQADGTPGEVQSSVTVTDWMLMYNLTVDEAHTYFVGDGEWLVHNRCIDYSGDPRFSDLAIDPQTGKTNNKSKLEAQGILEAENQGLLTNPRRPNAELGESTQQTDFFATYQGVANTPVDTKTPVSPSYRSLSDQVNDITGHVGTYSNDVVVIINLQNLTISDASHFVSLYRATGARTTGVHFVND